MIIERVKWKTRANNLLPLHSFLIQKKITFPFNKKEIYDLYRITLIKVE